MSQAYARYDMTNYVTATPYLTVALKQKSTGKEVTEVKLRLAHATLRDYVWRFTDMLPAYIRKEINEHSADVPQAQKRKINSYGHKVKYFQQIITRHRV